MRTFRKLVTAVAAAAALAGSGLLAPAASAAPQEGVGHETRPGQPYGGVQRARDWLGSYLVNGEQVWCVQFALTAPDSHEEYRPGDALKTKWGTPLPDGVAANISYLLLRYGDTRDPPGAGAWTPAEILPITERGNKRSEGGFGPVTQGSAQAPARRSRALIRPLRCRCPRRPGVTGRSGPERLRSDRARSAVITMRNTFLRAASADLGRERKVGFTSPGTGRRRRPFTKVTAHSTPRRTSCAQRATQRSRTCRRAGTRTSTTAAAVSARRARRRLRRRRPRDR